MTRLQLVTANDEVSILILIGDKDISIFFRPDCRTIPIEGGKNDMDGVMILKKDIGDGHEVAL